MTSSGICRHGDPPGNGGSRSTGTAEKSVATLDDVATVSIARSRRHIRDDCD